MIKILITKSNKKAFDLLKNSIGVFNGRYALDRIFFDNGKLITTNTSILCILDVKKIINEFDLVNFYNELEQGKVYIPTFIKDCLLLEKVGENMGVDVFPDYKRAMPKKFNRALKTNFFKKQNAFNSFLTSTSLQNTLYDADQLESFIKYSEDKEIEIYHSENGCCFMKCKDVEFLIMGCRYNQFEEIELN